MKREIVRILLVLIVAIISASSGSAQDKKDTLYRHNKALNSISLPKNMKWYNTNSEFKIDGIFNKIVVIHVWEPGSIFHDESILRANEIQRERRDVVIMTILNSSKKEYGPEMVADIVKASTSTGNFSRCNTCSSCACSLDTACKMYKTSNTTLNYCKA